MRVCNRTEGDTAPNGVWYDVIRIRRAPKYVSNERIAWTCSQGYAGVQDEETVNTDVCEEKHFWYNMDLTNLFLGSLGVVGTVGTELTEIDDNVNKNQLGNKLGYAAHNPERLIAEELEYARTNVAGKPSPIDARVDSAKAKRISHEAAWLGHSRITSKSTEWSAN